jgi:cytochrome bd-type quinol oxidase subunit 2
MTYLVVLAFVAILASLASALFFMMRNGKNETQKGNKMAKALAFRVGFSVVLFLCILLAWKLGYIKPTGLPATDLPSVQNTAQ